MNGFNGSWSLWDEFPVLIIGNYLNTYDLRWIEYSKTTDQSYLDRYSDSRKWNLIEHQAGGLYGHQHFFVGTQITPSPTFLEFMREISTNWLGSCLKAPCNLTTINSYGQYIQKFSPSLSCENNYMFFQEGIYPIDLNQDIINRITADDIPLVKELASTFYADTTNTYRPAMHLFVLGANCD